MLSRRMKLSIVSTLFVMLLALLLTACGGSSTASSSGPVTVNWISWNPGPPLSTQFVTAFNASHPKIKLVFKNEVYDDYIKNLKLTMASGTGPDIFGTQAGAMQKAYAPFMEDLTPYAQKAWGSDWRSRFLSFGLDALTVSSVTHGLPLFDSAAGYLWYNKTIFDKYGLQPPKTFDQWVSVSNTLRSKGVTPFVQGAKDTWVDYDMYIALANAVAPGKFYQAEAGKIPWTDPDLVKAMDYWHQLFHNGIMQKGAVGATQYPDANDLFNKGQAAMILFGTWQNGVMTNTALATNKTTYKLTQNYVFLPTAFPSFDGSGQGGKLFGGPDVGLAMNNASKVKDAAWQVLSWLTSDEAQKINAKVLNTPSIKGVSIDTSDVATDVQKEALTVEAQDLSNVIGPREITYPELQTALGDALQNVATDSQTPQQAMAAVQQVSQGIQR